MLFRSDADLVWPVPGQSGYREQPLREIIADSLDMAARGLASIGIATTEAERYMDVIRERLASGQTGAVWQRRKLAQLKQQMPDDEALHQLLESFMGHSEANLPVAHWPV